MEMCTYTNTTISKPGHFGEPSPTQRVLSYLGLEQVGPLGRGMSEVILARDVKDQSKTKAVKIFHLNEARGQKFNAALFFQEVSILQKVTHPHILGNTSAHVQSGVAVLTMAYYSYGSLEKRLRAATYDHDGDVPVEDFFVQISCALRYLHRNGVVHRDVKPDNILLDGERKAVLCDFGVAVTLAPGEKTLTQPAGTYDFMAPEVRHSYEGNLWLTYDPFKADAYSMGLVLWQMMMGHGATPCIEELHSDNPHVCQCLMYAAQLLLVYDAKDRMTVTQVLSILSHMGWNSDYIKSL